MNYLNVGWILLFLLIVALIFGAIKVNKESSIMYEKCLKTDLYVVDHKGIRNRVYDCSEVTVN